MDKKDLALKIKALEGLSNDEKSAMLELLHEQKKYGLVWEDKPEDVEIQLKSELPVLTEVKERAIVSEDKDAPNHIIIEGDNLHALVALSYTHAGKIDVIYIDPPYNTGNKDFIFNDNYVDKEDAYRHSKWLSFMSKRLEIAKGLLSEKGVIFISIDDNEQSNLKLLCDEVFGEKNFVANLIWKSKSGGANDASSFGIDHEYLFCYAHRIENVNINNDKEATVTTSYNKIDENGKRYSLDRLDKQSLGYLASLDFPIKGPDGKVYVVEHKDPSNKKARWRWAQDTVQERYDELVFIYPYVYTKNYEKEDGQKARSILFDDRFGRTRTGSTDLASIIGKQDIFNYPKPVKLIKYIIDLASSTSSIILDFFAGSGTTLHATMQLNEDGGHRQCILVTNNENNICEEITYERNRRVIQGYTKSKGEAVEGLHSNNLRYYKTTFVQREKTMANRRALTAAATDLLCIKNNVYQEVGTFGGVKIPARVGRYFDDGKTKMLIIYLEAAVFKFVELLLNMEVEGKILVYVFSGDNYAYNNDFVEVLDKVELCALPDAIYKAYKKALPSDKITEDAEIASENETADANEEDEK